jgi:hypothetical protein
LAFLVTLFTVIGAILLRGGCALYNWLARRMKSMIRVPEPSFGKAMGITFVTSLVGALVWFPLCGLLAGPDDTFAGASGRNAFILAYLISLSVSLLVTAAMNAALLPTTFTRGFLVALYSLVVAFFVGVVVGALLVGVGLVYSPFR